MTELPRPAAIQVVVPGTRKICGFGKALDKARRSALFSRFIGPCRFYRLQPSPLINTGFQPGDRPNPTTSPTVLTVLCPRARVVPEVPNQTSERNVPDGFTLLG